MGRAASCAGAGFLERFVAQNITTAAASIPRGCMQAAELTVYNTHVPCSQTLFGLSDRFGGENRFPPQSHQ